MPIAPTTAGSPPCSCSSNGYGDRARHDRKGGKGIAGEDGEERHAEPEGRDGGKHRTLRNGAADDAADQVADAGLLQHGAERRQHQRQHRGPADRVHQPPPLLQRRQAGGRSQR
jgi:hypothetical protein